MAISDPADGLTLRLAASEAELLRDVIENAHRHVLLELSRTDSLEYKDTLRPREAVLAKVLSQIDSAAASA